MLPLCQFRQKYPFDCTVASIYSVLKYYRIQPLPTYDDLVRESECHKNHGTAPSVTMSLLKKYGLKPEYYEFATTDDLHGWYRLGIPTLVSWFSPAPGPHTSVVKCVGPSNITLFDPGIGRERMMPLSLFREVWFVLDPGVTERAAKRSPRKYISWREAVVAFPPSSKRKNPHQSVPASAGDGRLSAA